MPAPEDLDEIYTDELKDLWSANDQMSWVLKKITGKAKDAALKEMLQKSQEGIDDARGQVLGIARGATDTAAFYSQRIKDAIASANQNVRHTSNDLGASASNAVSHLGDYARGGAGQSLASSPIVLGAVAALAGMVVAAFVPVSRQEERALGSLAGQLRGKSRALAQDVVDRGAQLAGDALGAVKDSAQAHGLTAEKPVGELLGDLKSGELIGHIKQAAREVADAGRESVRSQLTPEADVKHEG